MEAAERYAEMLQPATVRERPLFPLPVLPSELQLQARWFAGDFGRDFRSVGGERIHIVQFGEWNREAGPDFRQTAIELGDDRDLKRGAIELDLADRNWELHGHSSNPAFNDTILHIFFERRGQAEFFTRTHAHRFVPQLLLDQAACQTQNVVLPVAHPGRCVGPLQDYGDEKIAQLLRGAAEFRLRRKTERMRQRIAAHGRDEALYQALADALGFKSNRVPFTLLAQRIPLPALRRTDTEALLFGVAGFLEQPSAQEFGADARGYVRRLWDEWWKQRDSVGRLVLPYDLWKLSGARPLNHPHRRLGALAALVRNWKEVRGAFDEPHPARLENVLGTLHHQFWDTHYTLAAAPIASAQALLGRSRIVEILANVFYPIALLEGCPDLAGYFLLRAELSNRSLEIAGARLFADAGRARTFLRTVAGQQGLLQIYEDFCLRDASDCANCPFPEQLRKF